MRAVAGVPASSIGTVLARIPSSVFLQMLAASAAIFLVSAVACVVAGVSGRSSPLALTLYALTGIAWYAVMTSVFGDGYVELARHAQLASVALYAAAVVLAAALFAPLLGIFDVANRRAIAAVAFAVLAIGVAVLSQTPLRQAMSMTPMAFGLGEGSKQTAPLGRAVIGGLAMATLATLIILPSVYAVLQKRASTVSPSLDPNDPSSRYYEHA